MGVARLQAGIVWICSKCGDKIPNGEGIAINKKPYCESCGDKIYEKIFGVIRKKLEEIKVKIKENKNG